MRTTLDLDADVLQAVKELAQLRNRTAGQVLSDLARKALEPDVKGRMTIRNGVPLMPRQTSGTAKMTMATVNALRDAP
ncbi:MAG: CopG family transcriptional regulator [Acidobacteriota bacterium]